MCLSSWPPGSGWERTWWHELGNDIKAVLSKSPASPSQEAAITIGCLLESRCKINCRSKSSRVDGVVKIITEMSLNCHP